LVISAPSAATIRTLTGRCGSAHSEVGGNFDQ